MPEPTPRNLPPTDSADASFEDGSPIYRQIADQLKASILSSALGPDEQVMSTNQYAAFYRINPATAAKAFQQLADEGLLYKRRGLGMFVAADAHERLRAQHRERFVADVLEPLVAEARVIGIPLAEVVREIEAIDQRTRDAQPRDTHATHDSDTRTGETS